jgi:hypothetical protein
MGLHCFSFGCALGAASLFAQGDGWSRDASPVIWESTHVRTAPQMDGQRDSVWSKARPVTVTVREAMGGDHARPVILRALHTDDAIFIAAEWEDATKSDMRDPYIWNAGQKRYDRPSRPDDQFAIEFPLSGDFAISMLTVEREYKADVWHWKAGRGNPIGWVDDKYHVISQSPVPNGKEHKLHSGRRVFIARAQDAGKSPYAQKPEPVAFAGDLIDSFLQQEPDGSMADIRGKGSHTGKGWFLEMGRKFSTSRSDDAVIDPRKDNPCAVAVLDDELYEEHSVSTLIHLRLKGGPGVK